ncbi:MAG: ABC transporter ATP-binding protein [Lachnospiraceae bacterium]|nr:ABC transporter ATP-binding protein [Lachnospiraceae bacterium]
MSVIRIIKKFRSILSRHQKLRIFELGVLMLIGAVFETMSVSLIVPFMNAVMEPEKTMQKPYVQLVCRIFDLHSPRTFLVVLAVIMAALYIIKNVFLLFENNIQYRFVYGNMFAMQRQILANFIRRPYEDFLLVNSGEVIRIISNDTSQVFALLTQLLEMFTELIVSIALVIVTFIIAPVITICIAALLIVLMLVINYILKPILNRAGKNTQKSSAAMNSWLMQSIQGIKELKVQRKEEYFQENYDKAGTTYVNSLRQRAVLGVIPRFMLEAISMGAFFIIVALMIYKGADLNTVVPMLSAVAMAAVRLLPSVNRISAALTSISYTEPMLDKLLENLKTISGSDEVSLAAGNLKAKTEAESSTAASVEMKPAAGAASADSTNGNASSDSYASAFPRLSKAITVEDIVYHYPNTEKNVLDHADMTVTPGESVGIVGASGAGKTTLVDIILGLLRPASGRVAIDGTDIRTDSQAWLAQIGYIPQMIFMLDGTIRENVAFGEKREDIDDKDVWAALREASMEDFVKSLPDGLDTELGERGVRISGGQRQRIGIARALYTNPSVLIFDEATSALDNETEAAIMDSINHLHGTKTMIIIAHRLTTIEGCDHVYRVEGGKIRRER